MDMRGKIIYINGSVLVIVHLVELDTNVNIGDPFRDHTTRTPMVPLIGGMLPAE